MMTLSGAHPEARMSTPTWRAWQDGAVWCVTNERTGMGYCGPFFRKEQAMSVARVLNELDESDEESA